MQSNGVKTNPSILDDGWAPSESDLAEIDQFILTHSELNHQLGGVRSHPLSSTGILTHPNSSQSTQPLPSLIPPPFHGSSNSNPSFSSDPQLLQSELLQKGGEVQLLRQRLESAQTQLAEVSKTHQVEKETWKRQFQDQTLKYQQEVDSLKTQLAFVFMNEYQQKWKPSSGISSSSSSSSSIAPSTEIPKNDQGTSPLVPLAPFSPTILDPPTFSASTLLSKKPLYQVPTWILDLLYSILQIDDWKPASFQILFTNTLNGSPMAMCYASELLLESFQHQQFHVSLKLVHLINFFSLHLDWTTLKPFLNKLPMDDSKHVMIVLIELVLSCSVHHYRTHQPLDDLVISLFHTMRTFLTSSCSNYRWLSSLYRPYFDRVEFTYIFKPTLSSSSFSSSSSSATTTTTSSSFHIQTKIAMLRWLIYFIPSLPPPTPKKKDLAYEILRGLDPLKPVSPSLRFYIVRFGFLYFHHFPPTFPFYLKHWIQLSHDTWCMLPLLSNQEKMSSWMVVYLCFVLLVYPFHIHPPSPHGWSRISTLKELLNKEPLTCRYLKSLVTKLLQPSSIQPSSIQPSSIQPFINKASTVASTTLSTRCFQRHQDTFLIKLKDLANQIDVLFFKDSPNVTAR